MAAFLLLFSCPHSGNGILIRRLDVGSVAVRQVERTVVDAVILQRIIRVDRDGKAAAEGTGFYDGAGYSDVYSNPGYAKKSADGKIVYWYTNDAGTQFNQSGYTYYYRALG